MHYIERQAITVTFKASQKMWACKSGIRTQALSKYIQIIKSVILYALFQQ